MTVSADILPDLQTQAASAESPLSEPLLREVSRAMRGMRYGSIEIVIHDGRVTQIERREKLRFDAKSEKKI